MLFLVCRVALWWSRNMHWANSGTGAVPPYKNLNKKNHEIILISMFGQFVLIPFVGNYVGINKSHILTKITPSSKTSTCAVLKRFHISIVFNISSFERKMFVLRAFSWVILSSILAAKKKISNLYSQKKIQLVIWGLNRRAFILSFRILFLLLL